MEGRTTLPSRLELESAMRANKVPELSVKKKRNSQEYKHIMLRDGFNIAAVMSATTSGEKVCHRHCPQAVMALCRMIKCGFTVRVGRCVFTYCTLCVCVVYRVLPPPDPRLFVPRDSCRAGVEVVKGLSVNNCT